MTVYNNERSLREGNGTSEIVDNVVAPPVSTTTPAMVTTTTPIVAPTPDPVAELTKQFSQLALALQAGLVGHPPTASPSNVSTPGPACSNDRPFRCVWCDSTEHARRYCLEFTEALRSKQVSLDEKGRILYNGEELPLMYGKGGMKRLIASVPISVGSKYITLENYRNLSPEPLKV